MNLSSNEIRVILSDLAFKIYSWSHEPDVATKATILQTLKRMTELAEALTDETPT